MTREDLPEPFRSRLALRLRELEDLCGLSGYTLRQEVAVGRLRATRIGRGSGRRHYIVAIDEALRWLSGREAPAGGEGAKDVLR